MINSIGFSMSQMLALESNVSINSTSNFNAQEAYENTFEDIIVEKVTENKKNDSINKNQFFEAQNLNIKNSIQFDELSNENEKNKNNSPHRGFEKINFKNAINTYMLESIK